MKKVSKQLMAFYIAQIALALVIILIVGGSWVIGGHIVPSVFIFFVIIFARLIPPIQSVVKAYNSLQAGDDIKTVQENLGHATASFTLATYAHATQGMKRESANRMDAFIRSVREAGQAPAPEGEH